MGPAEVAGDPIGPRAVVIQNKRVTAANLAGASPVFCVASPLVVVLVTLLQGTQATGLWRNPCLPGCALRVLGRGRKALVPGAVSVLSLIHI